MVWWCFAVFFQCFVADERQKETERERLWGYLRAQKCIWPRFSVGLKLGSFPHSNSLCFVYRRAELCSAEQQHRVAAPSSSAANQDAPQSRLLSSFELKKREREREHTLLFSDALLSTLICALVLKGVEEWEVKIRSKARSLAAVPPRRSRVWNPEQPQPLLSRPLSRSFPPSLSRFSFLPLLNLCRLFNGTFETSFLVGNTQIPPAACNWGWGGGAI